MPEKTVLINPRHVSACPVTRAALQEARAALVLPEHVSVDKENALFYKVECRWTSGTQIVRLWCSREEIDRAWEEINKPSVKHLQRLRSLFNEDFEGVLLMTPETIRMTICGGSGSTVEFVVLPEKVPSPLRSYNYYTEAELLDAWKPID